MHHRRPALHIPLHAAAGAACGSPAMTCHQHPANIVWSSCDLGQAWQHRNYMTCATPGCHEQYQYIAADVRRCRRQMTPCFCHTPDLNLLSFSSTRRLSVHRERTKQDLKACHSVTRVTQAGGPRQIVFRRSGSTKSRGGDKRRERRRVLNACSSVKARKVADANRKRWKQTSAVVTGRPYLPACASH